MCIRDRVTRVAPSIYSSASFEEANLCSSLLPFLFRSLCLASSFLPCLTSSALPRFLPPSLRSPRPSSHLPSRFGSRCKASSWCQVCKSFHVDFKHKMPTRLVHRVCQPQYSIGVTIRDMICSQQPVSRYELTGTHSVKIVYVCLYWKVPGEASCYKVASWNELVCTGSQLISRSILYNHTVTKTAQTRPFYVSVPI